MKNVLVALLFILTTASCSQANQTKDPNKDKLIDKPAESSDFHSDLSDPVDHSGWNALLKKHVNDKGMVDYKAMIADSVALNKYLDMLSVNVPDEDVWTDAAKLAYWINAYNAFTVKLIIKNYPVKSIKDIAGGIPFVNTPWDVKFIEIGDETYDLNNIEHGIIRKEFNEERIHFALVCAAISCPRLRNEAYTAEKLNDQLNDQARTFFNDSSKNKISQDNASVSPLLKWYGGDFKDKAPGLREYVNQYSKVQINEGVDIEFTDYDWSLNEQK